MDPVLKMGAVAAGTVALLALNLWFVRWTVDSYRPRSLPASMAPLRLSGVSDTDGKAGASLANLLIGRLGSLRAEIGDTLAQLDQPVNAMAGQLLPQDLGGASRVTRLEVPTGLLAPLDIDMSIAGVEVGGIFKWIHDAVASDDALHLTVDMAKGTALVSGVWNGGRDSLWLEVTSSAADQPVAHRELIEAMAFALAKRQLEGAVPELTSLRLEDFRTLVTTLRGIAELDRQSRLGAAAAAGFKPFHDQLSTLMGERAPNWRALVQLSARVAERAGEFDAAGRLYERLLTMKDLPERDKVRIQTALAAIEAQQAPPRAPGRAPATAEAPSEDGWPLAAIGATALRNRGRGVRIAIVGGLPLAETLRDVRHERLGPPGRGSDSDMAEYVSTLVQTVRLLAPDATFVFAPAAGQGGALSTADLLTAMNHMVEAQPDVLLLTFAPLQGAAMVDAIEILSNGGTVVVTAAGNEGRQTQGSLGTPLERQVLVSSAVDGTGRPARFSSRSNLSLWAPGVDIPIQERSGRPSARSGTAYSAALTAGAAALLREREPSLTPMAVRERLLTTSVANRAGGPRVIRVDKALASSPN